MGSVLAIDPGTTRSAWVQLGADGTLELFGIEDNPDILDTIQSGWVAAAFDAVVIEKVESFGMAVGAEVFETVRWAGRFEQAAHPAPVHRIGRKAVKLHLCGSPRAKDPNIRQALIDRYGGPEATKKGGLLHGVSKDVWAALAVAVTWQDTAKDEDAAA